MCWNEPISWTVFFVGTLFNMYLIWKFRTATAITVAITWQWVLLMQLFDALLWRDQNCGRLNKFATNSAYIANITQPIVVFLSLIVISTANIKLKIMSTVIILFYIIYMIQSRPNIGKLDCVQEKGGHLNYFWWDKMKFGGIIYAVVLVLIMLLLLRPVNLSIFEVSYILITLGISIAFFKYSTPSIWCWFAAFAPIANVIFFSFNKK